MSETLNATLSKIHTLLAKKLTSLIKISQNSFISYPYQRDISQLKISDIETARIGQSKKLDIILDGKLIWKSHAIILTNKISKNTRILH